ncbi:MAG: hypothetical protein IPM64_03690 [Phycisphaerales bacterium]|nr:hypothetical protein [Phycisphaerales bacterium]
MSHAVREAYRSLIDPSRYPVTFLFLSIDPAAVDVNVHPTKIELRWRDSNFVHAQVLAALRDKFLSMNLDHRLRGPRPDDAERARIRTAMVDFLSGGSAGTGQRPAPDGGAPAHGAAAVAAEEPPWGVSDGRTGRSASTGEVLAPVARAGETTAARAVDPLRAADALPMAWGGQYDAEADRRMRGGLASEPGGDVAVSGRSAAIEAERAPGGGAAGERRGGGALRAIQVHNTYLVVEDEEGLLIIDQHALHERILYEELRRRVSQRPLESQRLLLPDVVSVPPDRLEALETHAETLARLGIELSAAGPRSVAVQAFPSLLERVSRPEFVSDLLDLLSESGAHPAQDTLLHRVLDMAACKAAVKAGDPLTAGEIEALLERRATAERSSHCPHGRPTTLHFSLRELERHFKRR